MYIHYDYMHMHTHTCTRTRTHAHTHTHIHTHVHTHTRMHACTHTHNVAVLPTPPLSTIVRADVAVPLGEDISLRVDNYTGPIIWWKDGEVLTNGTKYRVFVDAGSSFFTVSSITEADGGVYQTEPLERVLTHVIYSLTVIGEYNNTSQRLT